MGKLSLTITDPEGKAISTARVDLKRGDESIPAYPDAQGEIEISLPPGEWQLTTKDNGREALDTKIVIRKDKVTNEKITLRAIRYILPSPRKTGIHALQSPDNGVEGPSPRLGPRTGPWM